MYRTTAGQKHSRTKRKKIGLAHSFLHTHTKKTVTVQSTICQSHGHRREHSPKCAQSPFHKHNITKNCTFLTTPINWDLTDQAADFQLASHNYAPCLPLHPLPLLSLLLTLTHTHSMAVVGGAGGFGNVRKCERQMKRQGEKNQCLIDRERGRGQGRRNRENDGRCRL